MDEFVKTGQTLFAGEKTLNFYDDLKIENLQYIFCNYFVGLNRNNDWHESLEFLIQNKENDAQCRKKKETF